MDSEEVKCSYGMDEKEIAVVTAPSADEVDSSSYITFPVLSYTLDDTHEEPSAVASDDGTFDEMKWLLGAEEPHVRAIAAQVLLGLAADPENRRRICSVSCVAALVARIFDRVCGCTVQRVVVKLSMDSTIASEMIQIEENHDEVGLFDELEHGIKRGHLTYETAALLANLTRIQGRHIDRVCTLVVRAIATPIKHDYSSGREAMEDEPATPNDHHFRIYEVLCMAAAIAAQSVFAHQSIPRLWKALVQLDRNYGQLRNSQRWNDAVISLFWNASICGVSFAGAEHAFVETVAQRPTADRLMLKLRPKWQVVMQAGSTTKGLQAFPDSTAASK